MASESVNCCVTSPPYWGLRDYGTAKWAGGKAECDHRKLGSHVSRNSTLRCDGREHAGPYDGEKATVVGYPFRETCGKCGARRIDAQLGLEPTPELYVAHLVEVFREVKRVLRADGTCWVNLGDSWANDTKWGGSTGGKHVTQLHGNTGIGRQKNHTGLKPKDLVGIPWRVAFALQADGWHLRSDIIWHKPNSMPESVRDRPTKAHEYLFLLSKSESYYYDAEAIKEAAVSGGKIRPSVARNKRSVWTIPTNPYPEAHFATFPPALVRPCILAGCPLGGTVLDPFAGSGTTGQVAQDLGCDAILIELNPAYCAMIEKRTAQTSLAMEATS